MISDQIARPEVQLPFYNNYLLQHVPCNIEREVGGWNRGYWFEFESKMASSINVVFMEDRIMGVAYLMLLTHKFFKQPSPSLFVPLSCLNDSIDFLSGLCMPPPSRAIHSKFIYWNFRV